MIGVVKWQQQVNKFSTRDVQIEFRLETGIGQSPINYGAPLTVRAQTGTNHRRIKMVNE